MMFDPSMEAFTIGYCRKAAAAARTTKGRNVRLNPYWAWNCPLIFSRSFATRVISTLCTVVTCAEVRLLKTMCSAIFWRIVDIGSMRVAGISPVRAIAGGGGGTFTGVGIVATAAAGCWGGGCWGAGCGGAAGADDRQFPGA